MAERNSAQWPEPRDGDMYRLLFEGAHDAILLTAVDGPVLRANAAACRIFGMSEAEICAAGRTGLVDLSDPRLADLLAMRERTGRAEGALTFFRKGGIPFEAELWSSVFEGKDGESQTWMVIRDVSERVRMEDEVRRINAYLAAQAEASPDGIMVFDQRGAVVTHNRRFLRIWSLDSATVAAGCAAIAEKMLAIAGGSAEARQVVSCDPVLDLVTVTGEVSLPGGTRVLCHSTPLWVGATHMGRVWYHRDVTELRKAEAEARTTAAILAAQFEASPEALVVTGPDGRVVTYNRRSLEMSGLTEADMVASPEVRRARLAALTTDPAGASTLFDEESLHPEQDHHVEVVLADGRVIEQHVRPLELPQGRGVAWFYRDITEQKRLIEAVRAGERRLRDVLNAAIDGIIGISVTGVIETANPAAEQIFGYGAGELIGLDVAALMPAPYAAVHARDVERYVRTGEAHIIGKSRDLTGLRKDGTTFPLELAVNETGEADHVRFVGIVRDITARKRAEEALVAAQKAESLGVLAGGIAHQLNNLLMGIMGNAGFVAMEALPGSPAGEALRDIEEASANAASLARALLSYSGAAPDAPSRVDLSQLAGEVTGLLTARRPPGVSLVTNFAVGLPAVRLNPARGRELLTHLLVNAFEALAEVGGEVVVSTGLVSAAAAHRTGGFVSGQLPQTGCVSLEIADNGPGIAADVLPRVFDPFFSTRFIGRGLGLAAALGIVRAAGGAIHVSSEPGKGATFTVLVPVAGDE